MADLEKTGHDLEALIAQMLRLEREGDALVLWHCTPAADAILARGWQDGGSDGGLRGAMSKPELGNGVYVSNRPLDSNEGAKGRELLRILLNMTEQEIADCEVVDESGESTYREWCLPAALLNERACTARGGGSDV